MQFQHWNASSRTRDRYSNFSQHFQHQNSRVSGQFQRVHLRNSLHLSSLHFHRSIHFNRTQARDIHPEHIHDIVRQLINKNPEVIQSAVKKLCDALSSGI